MKSTLRWNAYSSIICLVIANFASTQPTASGCHLQSHLQDNQFFILKSQIESCTYSHELELSLANITKAKYAENFQNFEKLWNLGTGLSNDAAKQVIFASLVDVMYDLNNTHTEEMLKLSYTIRLAMESVTNDSIVSSYENLKRKLPRDIRAITFSQHLTWRNLRYNEYVYVSDTYIDGKPTLKSHAGECVYGGAYFMEPVFISGGEIRFRIFNVRSSVDTPVGMIDLWTWDGRGRWLGICSGKDGTENDFFLWKLVPNSANNGFSIQNWDTHFIYTDPEYVDGERFVYSNRKSSDISGSEFQYKFIEYPYDC